MKMLCLKPLAPIRVESHEIQWRGMDRLITCDPPGDKVEYVFEDNPQKLGKGFAAVRFLYDAKGDAIPKPVLLAPFRSHADMFGVSEVTIENASWLRVCLTFAQREYSPWTKQREIAALRAAHWFRSGDFSPKKDKELLWYSAIRWPHWRREKLGWKQCVADLEHVLKRTLTSGSEEAFNSFCERSRKMCERAGLLRDW